MEETKDNKRIITNEEFLQYKKQIKSIDTDLEQFFVIIMRERYGLSWLEIERLFGFDFDEDGEIDLYGIDEDGDGEIDYYTDDIDDDVFDDFIDEDV